MFIEARTYRFRAHSMFDAQSYRTKAEVEEWRKKDPVIRFSTWLRETAMLRDEDMAQMEREIDAEIAQAVAFAESGTWEPVEDLAKDTYAPRRAS